MILWVHWQHSSSLRQLLLNSMHWGWLSMGFPKLSGSCIFPLPIYFSLFLEFQWLYLPCCPLQKQATFLIVLFSSPSVWTPAPYPSFCLNPWTIYMSPTVQGFSQPGLLKFPLAGVLPPAVHMAILAFLLIAKISFYQKFSDHPGWNNHQQLPYHL